MIVDRMKDFQLRVVNERNELNEKIGKLTAFIVEGDIFLNLPKEEKGRLHDQLEIMRRYSAVLEERIEAFETND